MMIRLTWPVPIQDVVKRFSPGLLKTLAVVSQPADAINEGLGGEQFAALRQSLSGSVRWLDTDLKDGRVPGDADMLMVLETDGNAAVPGVLRSISSSCREARSSSPAPRRMSCRAAITSRRASDPQRPCQLAVALRPDAGEHTGTRSPEWRTAHSGETQHRRRDGGGARARQLPLHRGRTGRGTVGQSHHARSAADRRALGCADRYRCATQSGS
jgi:hypothetical protein